MRALCGWSDMMKEQAGLEAGIESGKPILVVEVSPPKSGAPEPIRAAAKRYAGKIHALSISDNRGGAGMAALAAAAIVAGEGVESILHMVTRDRNRLALVADALGAQALGIRNILCTSGTHQTLGICRPAKNVFDIDSIQLLEALSHVGTQDSVLGMGSFEGTIPLCLGAVAAPFADPPELQMMRLAKKIAAGAKFLITQPVNDFERFRSWWEAVKQRGLHEQAAILAGIRPLLDAEEAQAYAAARPLPLVSGAILERLSKVGSKSAQRQAGIKITLETIAQLSALDGIRGFSICEVGDGDTVLEIIDGAGLKGR